MNQPWGLSGPQFLGVYLAAFAVSALLAVAVRPLLRRGSVKYVVTADVYTLAVVGGGSARVVDAAVQALVEGGQLRASRDHKLAVCGEAAPDEPVQQALLEAIGRAGGTDLAGARRMGARTEAVRQVTERAVQRGLLLNPARRRLARVLVLVPTAVFGVGIARLVNGIRLGRPVGLLVGALIVTGLLLMAALSVPRVTLAGEGMLGRARRRHLSGGDTQEFGSYGATDEQLYGGYGGVGGPGGPGGLVGTDALAPTAVLSVAVLGAAGVADPTLRQALYGGLTSSSPSGSDSGGGGGDGGGSGCGGGGCGGGCGGCGG